MIQENQTVEAYVHHAIFKYNISRGTEFKENHEERIAKPGFKFTSSEAMSQNTLTFWAL